MKITLELLVANEACREQRELFAETFPEGVVPTRELVREYGSVFDLAWVAEALLPWERFDAFEDARTEAVRARDKAMEPVNRAYEQVRGPAYAAWQEKRRESDGAAELVGLYQAYRAVEDVAYAAYQAAEAPLTATFRLAYVDAFYDAWVQEYPEDAA